MDAIPIVKKKKKKKQQSLFSHSLLFPSVKLEQMLEISEQQSK